jgi:hypothetical protein
LEMLDIILEDYELRKVYIMTWSAGCCHLPKFIEMLSKSQCNVEKIIMVSPIVDLSNSPRDKAEDFLN